MFEYSDFSRVAKLSGQTEQYIQHMAGSEHKQHGDVERLIDILRKRSLFLELLADTSLDQRDLRDELGVSRSTVYKALQELTDAGLVTEYDGKYTLTGFGRLAWQRHD
ncbi:MAG: winged helix-turn-helix domain-containing protein, partial [Natronomonas sp.]